jgi:hypothetical protein
MNSIVYLYGLPTYVEKLNPDTYPKNEILSQIEENYKISNIRNNWDNNSHFNSDIHHSYEDDQSKIFNKINYYNLSNKYEKIINNFFEKINLQSGFSFNYEIVNYTCSKHKSFMASHIHPGCSFSLVHYISFDEKQHISTIFKSPYYFNLLLPNRKKLRDVFCNQSIENSWLYNDWTLETKEDDVVIFPSILEHYVRNFDSSKSRITISVNIKIEEKN